MKKQKIFLIRDKNYDAFTNMSIDEFLFFKSIKENKIFFRLYGWSTPSISIGYFQEIERYFDVSKLEKQNIPLVRRITGGRGVYHERELTYSFTMSRQCFSPFQKKEIFQFISSLFQKAFAQLDLKATMQLHSTEKNNKTGNCFRSASEFELISDYTKLVGSAQYISDKGVLQQGSIPLSSDIDKLNYFFKGNPGGKSVCPLKFEQKSDLIHAIADVCSNDFFLENFDFSDEDFEKIEKIRENKYNLKSWNWFRQKTDTRQEV